MLEFISLVGDVTSEVDVDTESMLLVDDKSSVLEETPVETS